MSKQTAIVKPEKYDIIAENDNQIRSLSLDVVRQFFCPLATKMEAELFIKICHAKRMNPFLREVYLIKYKQDQPASIVVGKDTFTQRAEDHPQFDGFNAGVIISNGKEEKHIKGSRIPKGWTLVGGWAEVSRKDRSVPAYNEVSMDEYCQRKPDGTPNRQWSRMPATMIRKVALCQSLREAFPKEFGGLYGQEEILAGRLPDYDKEDGRGENVPSGESGVHNRPRTEVPAEETDEDEGVQDAAEEETPVTPAAAVADDDDDDDEDNEQEPTGVNISDVEQQFGGTAVPVDDDDDLMPKPKHKAKMPQEAEDRPRQTKAAKASEECTLSDDERRAKGFISVKQIKRLFALGIQAGKTENEIREELAQQHNIEHIWQIKRGQQYDAICASVADADK